MSCPSTRRGPVAYWKATAWAARTWSRRRRLGLWETLAATDLPWLGSTCLDIKDDFYGLVFTTSHVCIRIVQPYHWDVFFSPKIIFEDWSRAVYVFEKRRLPFLLMIYYDLPMCFLKIKITNHHHHYYYLLWLTNDLLWFIIIWGYLDILITNSSPWLEDQVGKMPNCAGRCLA